MKTVVRGLESESGATRRNRTSRLLSVRSCCFVICLGEWVSHGVVLRSKQLWGLIGPGEVQTSRLRGEREGK